VNGTEKQRCEAWRIIRLMMAWYAGFEIEWITHGDETDRWNPCPLPPTHWDFLTFDFRVKP